MHGVFPVGTDRMVLFSSQDEYLHPQLCLDAELQALVV